MSIYRPAYAIVVLILISGCEHSVTDATPDADITAATDDNSAQPSPTDAGDVSEAATEQADTVESPTAGEQLLAALGPKPKTPAVQLAFDFDASLVPGDPASEQTAAELLAVTDQVVQDDEVAAYINQAAQENAVAAAKLLAWVVRAQVAASQFDHGPYAVGRLVADDESFSPPEVMAQVPITAEGYFATEIGDRRQPLSFRAPGFENLDVSLDGGATADQSDDHADEGDPDGNDAAKVPDGIVLGDVNLEPLADDQQATLHGRIAPDDVSQVGTSKVQLSLAMPKPNTPHNGYSPRRSWPDTQPVEVDKEGNFEIAGLNPSDYSLSITADEHAPLRKKVSLEPGEVHEAGDLSLRSTNLGFYVDAEEPDVPELAWEEDFDTALARAKSEDRPLMVMMTATWCGPCKALERDSLSNVWIRHFLAPFVVVQAYEEDKVEDKYGLRGYPTLVFCDSAGEAAFRSVGYRPAIDFAGEVAQALKAVNVDLPAELQTLIDKEVVAVE